MKNGVLSTLCAIGALIPVLLVAEVSGGRAPTIPSLPEPVSNNAVTDFELDGGPALLSAAGLGAGKSHRDVHGKTFVLRHGLSHWEQWADVPGPGRLAAVAVSVAGEPWLFGGYTVASDGEEVSVPGVYRLQRDHQQWTHATDMPIPVDDTVALVYQDRWIYLISGWHDLANVNLVQILDTHSLTWSQATAWPGKPVFGHAGGLQGRQMVVCGGVAIDYPADGSPRQFLPAGECWMGEIDAEEHRRIAWRPLPAPPVGDRYRMAAAAIESEEVLFVGGSVNPYNYNGVGYNGAPSAPESVAWRFRLSDLTWRRGTVRDTPSMDHRGLAFWNGERVTVGGMLANQQVTARVLRLHE